MELRRLDNRGQSVAYAWIYIMSSIFGIGFIYLILDQMVRVYLYNIAIAMNADSQLLTVIIYVWTLLPFLWIGALILWGIIYTIRQGREGDYVG